MVNINKYSIEIQSNCKDSNEYKIAAIAYKESLLPRLIKSESQTVLKDIKGESLSFTEQSLLKDVYSNININFNFTCPAFVYHAFILGNKCPEGLHIISLVEPLEGKAFALCGVVVEDAWLFNSF